MSKRLFTLRLSLFNAFLFLGSGIQLPFLPLWLRAKGLGEAEIALVMALMMAVRIFAMPLGTFVADATRNRKLVIHCAAFGAFAVYLLLNVVSGFWPILIVAILAAALLAPVVPLSESLALEGSAHFGIDYGHIRLWASLSFLSGSLIAGALLDVVSVSYVILLIAGAQGLGALMTLEMKAGAADTFARRPVQGGRRRADRGAEEDASEVRSRSRGEQDRPGPKHLERLNAGPRTSARPRSRIRRS